MENDQIKNELIRNLDDATLDLYQEALPRNHLGGSIIGKVCERELVYSFRWFNHTIFSPQTHRLFQRGHREEIEIIKLLRQRGWQVLDVEPDTKKQLRVSSVFGHFGGSLDGKVWKPPLRYWLLAEFKTYNLRTFEELIRDGFPKAKPQHWAQVCTYGYLDQIPKVAYFGVCKNDDRMHVEVKDLDWNHGAAMVAKASRVIQAVALPAKISESPAFHVCKYCDFKENCHGRLKPAVNCRSCRAASPVENGQWFCNRYGAVIPKEEIPKACPAWEAFG
jgi:hypothetical protein